jgi:hypothetical protein
MFAHAAAGLHQSNARGVIALLVATMVFSGS